MKLERRSLVLAIVLLPFGVALGLWAGDAYRAWLAHATSAVFALVGQRVEIDELVLLAPLDLVFYVLLLVAIGLEGWRSGSRRLALGLAILVAFEIGLGMVLTYSAFLEASHRPWPGWVMHWRNSVFASYPWVLPPALAVWSRSWRGPRTATPADGSRGAGRGERPARRPNARAMERRPAAGSRHGLPAEAVGAPIVLFDAECAMCDGFVRFVLSRDRPRRFYVVAQGSPLGERLLSNAHGEHWLGRSMCLLEGARLFAGSDAVLETFARLPLPWRLLRAFRFVPRGVRDPLYFGLAAWRRRGLPSDSCPRPPREWAQRVLRG